MRVLVCGSRGLAGLPGVEDRSCAVLDALHAEVAVTTVVSGCARGGDQLGERWAEFTGVPVERYPADWSKGRAAGFERNLAMLDTAPDLVVAFVDRPLAESKGTAHTVRHARQRGIEVKIYRYQR